MTYLSTRFSKLAVSIMVLLSHFTLAQTGYFENFNSGSTVPAIYSGGVPYLLSIDNQTLKIVIAKGDMWSGVYVTMPGPLNLSDPIRRKVSFRIRTDSTTRQLPFEIGIFLFSNPGQVGGRRANKVVYPTSKWQTISFDFNDPGFTSVNYNAVTAFQIVAQPQNLMLRGTIYMDDIAVGDNGVSGQAAISAPYFLGFENQDLYVNSASKTVNILNAVDAANLNTQITFSGISSNTAILPNPTFPNSPFLSNSYVPFTSGNGTNSSLLSSRPVFMQLAPNANQFGMVTVTVTATGPSVTTPHSYIFTTNVKRNIAPTIGVVPASLAISSDKKTEIKLDKIISGNSEVAQIMTITGASSDQSVISDAQILVSFNGVSLEATVFVTPVPFSALPVKNCNLTFTIRDNGGIAQGGANQTQYSIPVTVYPILYNQPTLGQIPNQIDNLTNQGQRIIRISGITDGNNASRIAAITAVSSNTAILANPVVNYTVGQNYATLSYNSAIVGSVQVSVTATNFGAPVNSNGNSSFTRVFDVVALAPPVSGFIESFAVSTIIGPANADGRGTTLGTWFVEAQGTIQNFSINVGTQTVTLIQNKPGTADAGYFSGVWYKPNGGGNLYNFKSSPYLSVTLSTTNAAGRVAIDLWDVNGIRYGLSSERTITTTPTTYTFCYNGTPSPGFDFSKIKTVLFNFGVTDYSTGAGNWQTYAGTYTMSNLRIGSDAQGPGNCPGNASAVLLGELPNPYHLTTQPGAKSVTLTGISAGLSPITGKNPSPVSLVVSGGLSANLLSFDAVAGTAVIGYTSSATPGTAIITINASAAGSTSRSKSFTVNVQATPSAVNLVVNNDLNANMPDGQKGQTIDGGPFGVCEIFGPGKVVFPDSYYEKLAEANIQSMRIGIYDFEPVNDNTDPMVLDKTKLDYDAMQVEFFKKASDAGVTKFLATFFSPPNFTKYNRASGVPAPPQGFIVTNTIDSAYYKEYAEYAVAFVQGVKEKSGVDIYGLSIGNEIQFNQTYQSVVINTQQYVEIIRAIGRRFAAEGIKTFLWGAETLQAQDGGNAYMKACQNDGEVRNYFAGYAVHSYAANGIGAGGPTTGNWSQILADSRDTRSNGALSAVRNSLVATVGPNGEPHNGNGGSGIPVHQTETSQSGLATYGEWSNAMDIFGAVISSANFGNVSGWYFIGLNETVDFYYTYKHINKFVFGGARRVPAISPAGTSSSAFRNPDNSLTILLGNSNTATRNISLGGTNMPSAFRAYMSVDNLFWQDLGTVTGSIVMPPNSLVTLWGGGNALVAASEVTVSGAGGATSINAAGGFLQLSSTVAPLNLVDKSVTWSVVNSTGNATIDQMGQITAQANGIVTVLATSNSTPSVFGQLIITISGQISIPLISMSLTSSGQSMKVITAQSGSLDFIPVFNPNNTTEKNVSWSVLGKASLATLNSNGFLKANNTGNGVLTVVATSMNNATITASAIVSISGQDFAVESISITGASSTISVNDGTLQLQTIFVPAGVVNTNVVWSSSNTNIATVANGLVVAVRNGTVTITGKALANQLVSAIYTITNTNQYVEALTLTVTGTSRRIENKGGTLQLQATIAPADAENKTVTWSLSATSIASISGTGIISTFGFGANQVVTVTATSVDAPNVKFNYEVIISNQQQAFITGPDQIVDAAAIVTFTGSILPFNATNGDLTWSVSNIAIAKISTIGVLTVIGNGIITITGARPPFGTAFKVVTITGQEVSEILIDLQGESSTITGVGKTRTVFYTVNPEELSPALKTIAWSASPAGIVEISEVLSDSYLLTALALGNTTITGVALNNVSTTLAVVVNNATGTANAVENAIGVFPNPSEGVFAIKIGQSLTNAKLEIQNSIGETILTERFDADKAAIDLSGYPKGLYHLLIVSDAKVFKGKVVVK